MSFYNSGSQSQEVYSLPIGIFKMASGAISSIDQVFNGFGYIGNTKFVLPGVKGLNPNGRNEDGTLNNTLITTETVLTITGASTDTVIGYFNSNSLNNHSTTTFIYDEELNLIVRTSDKKSYKEIYGEGKIPYTNTYHQTNGKIDFCTFHKVFHSLDYNDKRTIAGLGIPSDKYIDLTLGASGTTYTAPANGMFLFSTQLPASSYFAIFNGNTNDTGELLDISISAIVQNYVTKTFVKKGQTIRIQYVTINNNNASRFYYLEGEVV